MPDRARLPLVLVAAAAALAACGGASRDGASAAGPVGLPKNVWTWVDLAGTECSDGSQTGIAVSPGDRDDLVVFLDGGGVLGRAHLLHRGCREAGPYVRADWEAERDARILGSFLDRSAPGNPFARCTLVFVQYCTGDVHMGDAVQSYLGAPRPWHHKGRVNVQKALDFVAGALPDPPKLVVSGASAGGFGSLLAFDLFRRRFPAAKGYLVDDSGPLLVGDDITRSSAPPGSRAGGSTRSSCPSASAARSTSRRSTRRSRGSTPPIASRSSPRRATSSSGASSSSRRHSSRAASSASRTTSWRPCRT
jgi:Pectinacetylesterase